VLLEEAYEDEGLKAGFKAAGGTVDGGGLAGSDGCGEAVDCV